MAFYILDNSLAKTTVGPKRLLVEAASEAAAKSIASAYANGDSGWAGATVTAVPAASTMDADAALTGWTFKIQISGGAAQTVDPVEVSVVGDADDDLDDVAGKLVTALNALDDVANAAYSAPDLTVAGADDGIGDATVHFWAFPPSGDTLGNLGALFIAASDPITHEGLAAAALAIEFLADTTAMPSVIAALD